MWKRNDADRYPSLRTARAVFGLLGAALLADILSADQDWRSTAPAGRIGVVQTAGDDLLVRIAWSDRANEDETIDVRALDVQGRTLAVKSLRPRPGAETDVLLDRALAEIAAKDFQMFVTINAPDRGTMTAHPVRMVYACSEERSCRFEALLGLDAGRVAIDRRLVDAMDDQIARGSRDVLGDAMVGDPTLLGNVLTLSGQLEPWLASTADDCLCFWEGAYQRSPASIWATHQHSEVDETLGWFGPGAALGIGFQTKVHYLGTEWKRSGTTDAAVRIRCWRIAPGNSVQIDFVSGSGGGTVPQVLTIPRLRPCERSCDDAEVVLESDVTGRVSMGVTEPGTAAAHLTAHGTFETPAGTTVQPLIDFDTNAFQIVPMNGILDAPIAPCSSASAACSWSAAGAWGDVRLDTSAWIEVPTVQPARNYWSYAAARVESYRVTATGDASCTVSRIGYVELTGGIPAASSTFCDSQGIELTCGLVVDPWGS